jgi:hypothetical protein
MGRAVISRRWFSLPIASLAAVVGFSLSMGEIAGQKSVILPNANTVAGPTADAQRQEVARQLAATFDQAVKEHAAATEALAWLKPGQTELVSSLVPGRPIPKHPPFYGSWSTGLYQSQTLENCVKQLLAAGRNDELAVHLEFAQRYLNHDQPQYRAVACEFLSYFPLQMIDRGLLPVIAQRLGDSAKAFDGARLVMGQQADFITRLANGVSVADVARAALAGATGFQFPDARAFDVWWQGNRDCRHRLWYWVMRWERLPMAAAPPPGAGQWTTPVATAASKVSVETEFPALVAALAPDEALKTLLLAGNPGAIAAQSGAKTRFDPTLNVQPAANAACWNGSGLYIEPKVVARFVQDYSLKPRLLELLRQDQPWPEVVTSVSKNRLLNCVVEVLKIAATPSDAAAIQQALDHATPVLASDPALEARLTLLLTTLAPERSEQILLSQLEQNSKAANLAAELIRTTGLRHWDVIAPALRDGYVRETILPPLAGLRTPEAAKVLGGLLAREQLAGEDLKADLTRWGHEINGNGSRGSLFVAYVRAATLFNGNRPVIGEDLFNRARCFCWKGGPSEQDLEHNRGVPAARAEAIEKLREFFDQAAQPAR